MEDKPTAHVWKFSWHWMSDLRLGLSYCNDMPGLGQSWPSLNSVGCVACKLGPCLNFVDLEAGQLLASRAPP